VNQKKVKMMALVGDLVAARAADYGPTLLAGGFERRHWIQTRTVRGNCFQWAEWSRSQSVDGKRKVANLCSVKL